MDQIMKERQDEINGNIFKNILNNYQRLLEYISSLYTIAPPC